MTDLAGPAEAGALSLASAGGGDVPAHDRWLSPGELMWLSGRRVPKRRADWRLGRWVAKQAVLRVLDSPSLDPSSVEIAASPGGAPKVRVHAPGYWPDVSMSLSHSGGRGFAAAHAVEVGIGCDLEEITLRSEAFVEDYFTRGESAWIRADPSEHDLRATLVWSAKESVLKALGEGLRLDTRSVEVLEGPTPPDDGAWRAVTVRAGTGGPFRVWWRRTQGFAWTLALSGSVGPTGGYTVPEE